MESKVIGNRYEFVMLFDVENGNPNGDPDAGNAPRVDAETGYGYITDVCLKRKIRNYVDLVKEGEKGFGIVVKPDKALNEKYAAAYSACGLETGKKGANTDDIVIAREYMCKNYYDVRAFGMVMSTGDDPCGIVRGPVQINFARSIDPVFTQEVTITRQAITATSKVEAGAVTEMGKKNVIPYALYRAEGYVSAALAQKITGFSEEDLALLWEAIINMFEHDHSAARGKMCMRKLVVFKHNHILGDAPSHVLFDKIRVEAKNKEIPARCFQDYQIEIDQDMPNGVDMEIQL